MVVSPFQVKPRAPTVGGQQLLDSLPRRRGRFLCQVQLVELAFHRRRLRTLRNPGRAGTERRRRRWPGMTWGCSGGAANKIQITERAGRAPPPGAAAGVAAGDRVGLRGVGGDGGALGMEEGVAADVVGVPVGVDDQVDVSGVCAGPGSGFVGMAAETGVDQGRLPAGQQEGGSVGEGALPPCSEAGRALLSGGAGEAARRTRSPLSRSGGRGCGRTRLRHRSRG